MKDFVLKTFLLFISENKIYLITYIFFLIFSYPIQAIVLPKIFANFTQEITNNKLLKINFKNYGKYLIYLIITFIISFTAYLISDYMEKILIPKLTEFYINYIFKNILKLHESDYIDIDMSYIYSLFENIGYSYREGFITFCNYIFPQICTIILLIIYFFYNNLFFGLCVFLSLVIYLFLNYFLSFSLSNKSKERSNTYKKKMSYANDKMLNLFAIYSYGNIDNEINDFNINTKFFKKSYDDNLSELYKIKIINNIYNYTSFIFLIIILAYLLSNKKININIFILLLISLLYYYICFTNIINTLSTLIIIFGILLSHNDDLERLYKQNMIKPIINKKKYKINSGKIEFRNLHYKYDNKNIIFNNTNLIIEDKQKIAFIGSSGTGKTTLFTPLKI